MNARTILVMGATGNQGGAVTSALLTRGLSVRALVRNPSSDKAKALAARGVELVAGNLNDAASIEAAAAGVDGVFVNTTPFAPGVGIEGEIQQGRTVVEGLTRAKPAHVVYSSVSDADRNTGVPHFDSKADAERHLAESGLPVTITGPVFFSDNILFPWTLAGLGQGTFSHAMPGDRVLQVVSLRDIGRFNATVLARGPQLAGRRINYAGDELTSVQMAAVLSSVTGRTIEYQPQPVEQLRATSDDMALMFEWFDRVGYSADIQGLRQEFPEVEWSTFEDWARQQDWATLLA